uniref:Uncharacterized protein n=1 Tax=Rhizophora mucronata TaxID=61149 RepID=A0A2P2PMX4_RHIMU
MWYRRYNTRKQQKRLPFSCPRSTLQLLNIVF